MPPLRPEGGWTSLHMSWHVETVNALVAAGADVNAKSDTGWTPLHMAARDGYSEFVSALVAAGADVNAVNNNGETPQDVAIQYRDPSSEAAVEIIDALTPMEVSPAEPGEPMEEPMVGTSMLTIERVGERTEVRWEGGVLQFSPEFSPEANGEWRDVILDQGFFRLRPQD